MNRRQWIPTVALALALLTGCTGVEVSPPEESCSPSYQAPSKYGRFAAQQKAPGAAIQWGAYPGPKFRGDRYQVTVYLGGVKVDSKNQAYAPHGSVSAQRAKKYAGMTFEIQGKVKRGPKLVLGFSLQCTVA